MGVIALVTLFVVQRATRPVRELGEAIETRARRRPVAHRRARRPARAARR